MERSQKKILEEIEKHKTSNEENLKRNKLELHFLALKVDALKDFKEKNLSVDLKKEPYTLYFDNEESKYKDLKEYKADIYDSVPVYATAKYTFDTAAPVKPYVKGDLGYSINNNDAKDGVYYGVGAGLNINDNFNVDVMYKENKGKYEIGTKDYKADYRRVALGVGYNFNLGK